MASDAPAKMDQVQICDRKPRRSGLVSARDLMGFANAELLSRARGTQRAGAVWARCAGRVAREHTCGVFLKELPAGEPELLVYIDSNALMQDFTTNRDMYAARLRAGGLPVSRVRFLLSRDAGTTRARREERRREAEGRKRRQAPPELPPLTAQDEARVRLACERLPEGLRERASEAMRLSLRRTKAHTTGEGGSEPQERP